MTADALGSVAELWRFPVKSMLGERLDTATVTTAGIVGDRAYGIVDRATGKVASAKHPKAWPDLLGCRASFLEPPTPNASPPPALIELPDGSEVRTDAPEASTVLSRFFGRDVALITAAPADFTIDEYRPDQPNLNPAGDRNVVVDQRLGASFFASVGMPSAVPDGALVDLFPMSVLTTSSLRHFHDLEPDGQWDVRRFRMNVIIETPAPGLPENTWTDRVLGIGAEVALLATIPTPRCVMTTVAQRELPKDARILKAIATHNRLDVLGTGRYPCLGVYAVPTATGTIALGDRVALVPITESTPAPC